MYIQSYFSTQYFCLGYESFNPGVDSRHGQIAHTQTLKPNGDVQWERKKGVGGEGEVFFHLMSGQASHSGP